MKIEEQIGLERNLRRLLERENLSLYQLSEKAKINKSTAHNYLNGVVPKSLMVLIKISDFFSISIDELVFKKVKKHKSKQRGKVENKKNPISLGVLLKEVRIKKGLTQKDVATHLGVHAMFISKVENNQCGLPLIHLPKVVDLLDLDRDELLQIVLVEELRKLSQALYEDTKDFVYLGIPTENEISLRKIIL